MVEIPQVSLDTGRPMPVIGLGTWRLSGKECVSAVKEALKLGYRHFDTAEVYDNQKEIGEAIAGFPRENLFITSKFWFADANQASVGKMCNKALKELGVDYLDLYLMHWPDRSKPMNAILKAMHALREEGKIRNVGVSNFTIHHLQDLLERGISVSVNQVEFHPYLYQKELLEFCRARRIQLVAYRPIAKGAFFDDPLLQQIGKTYRKTPAQVILRWIIQKGIPVIPKAASKKHLEENLNIFDFYLKEEDVASIDRLNKNQRFCDADWSDFNY